MVKRFGKIEIRQIFLADLVHNCSMKLCKLSKFYAVHLSVKYLILDAECKMRIPNWISSTKGYYHNIYMQTHYNKHHMQARRKPIIVLHAGLVNV